MKRESVVVVGGGMVGHRFCERLRARDTHGRFAITLLAEEARAPYDRVQLTKFFDTRDPGALRLAEPSFYAERHIDLHLSERVASVDRAHRRVLCESGRAVAYDKLVLATGSSPFIPKLPGIDKSGVFAYRTLDDLQAIAEYAASARAAAVLGGGLLGLEAARAVQALGLVTHVVEIAPRLMPRQLDEAGARLLLRSVQALGVHTHLGTATASVLGDARCTGLSFADGRELEADMVVVSAGIRPRDDLARSAGLAVGGRGGVVVDAGLCTSDDRIYAIGECALHDDTTYGLVAPGYEMAEVLVKRLSGDDAAFRGSDQSAKLKLLGVDVAMFGDPFTTRDSTREVVLHDLVRGVYRKLVVSDDATRLLGGILVGDARDYTLLSSLARSGKPLPVPADALISGERSGGGVKLELADDAQVCSCNNVSKGELCAKIDAGAGSLAELKACTRVGTGCGGCLPLATELLQARLAKSGKQVRKDLCEHFGYSRQELYELIVVRRYRDWGEIIEKLGRGHGCEICKPAIASILASTRAELILDHDTLQDTNDRFLANIQRGGTYSVVPRIPGGEITPDKLIVLGQIAKKYGLYTKITGGQRIDLFGARVGELPLIWEDLVAAGFESGHAYGKAVRTVKSCVGSTWCRFGVQDSVGLAIRVEQRYRGLRAPHKLKSAVSGCVRECAEAQSKDFGVIATEKGWNLYVCGNGGATPRHADLLAADVDEATCLKYIDRFLMFYIRTADRLTRTSVWLQRLEGGIEHLRDVVVNDSLGLCAQLERDMRRLVDNYRCEWTEVVRSPALRARFAHFANTSEPDGNVRFLPERGQKRPADWDKGPAPAQVRKRKLPLVQRRWVALAEACAVPRDGGIAVRYGNVQLAVFHFASRGQWYATQNACPHRGDMVLARGILGDQGGTPKVACPMHKKTFALDSGDCLSGESFSISTFPVQVSAGIVYVELPPADVLEARLCANTEPCAPEHAGEAAE